MPHKTLHRYLGKPTWIIKIVGTLVGVVFASNGVCAEDHLSVASDAAPADPLPLALGQPVPDSQKYSQAAAPPYAAPRPAPPYWQQTILPPPTPTKWYGYQIMLVDVGTILLAIAGANAGSGGPAIPAAILYLSAPAAIHLQHNRGGLAILSPLLRLGVPALTALMIGLPGKKPNCSGDGGGFPCGYGGYIEGGLLGIVIAMFIDWGLASTQVSAPSVFPNPRTVPELSVEEPSEKPARGPCASWTTAGLVPQNGGVSLVFGGQF